MGRLGLALSIGIFLAAGGLAQTQAGAQQTAAASGNAQANQSSAKLASGSTVNATLDTALDSKKCKVGDTVKARSTEDVKSNGETVLPKGTKLVGHITQASAKAKGDSESTIGLVFDKAILKHGEEVPVNLAIQAIGAAPSNPSAGGYDTGGMGGYPAPSGGGSGGMTGGTPSSAGAPTSTMPRTGGAVGRTVDPATNAAGNVAGTSEGAAGSVTAGGQFAPNSHGVFGLEGLSLNTSSANNAQGSVLASNGKHVQIESGARLLLVSQAQPGGNGR